jgi:hypothetical protein
VPRTVTLSIGCMGAFCATVMVAARSRIVAKRNLFI